MGPDRIHYLDWLKVLIVYGIVVFHVSLVFTFGGWVVSNHDHSYVLSAFAGFCFPWGIPAMFLIAGADAWFGLRSRPLGGFLRSRAMRLLLPMALGLAIISPFQRFVSSANPPPSLETFWAYYLAFFRNLHFSWSFGFISTYWLHLWFLGYLFAITLVCSPALLFLRRPTGRRLIAWLVAVAGRRFGLLLLAAPLVVAQLALRPFFPAYQDWADIATFTLVFLWGAVFFGDRGFESAIVAQIRSLVACGVLAGLGVVLLGYVTRINLGGDPAAEFEARLAQALLWSLFVWSWLLAVMYLGIRWFNFPNRAMAYAEESVLPIYVIHHPVVVTIASFVVTWNLSVWPKFLVILVATFAVTLAVYELGVRRWRLTRALFGLAAPGKNRWAAPQDTPLGIAI